MTLEIFIITHPTRSTSQMISPVHSKDFSVRVLSLLVLIIRPLNPFHLGSWRSTGNSTRSSPPRPRSPPTQRAQDTSVCTAFFLIPSVHIHSHSRPPAFTLNSTVVPAEEVPEPSSLEAPTHSGAHPPSQSVPCQPYSSPSSFPYSPIQSNLTLTSGFYAVNPTTPITCAHPATSLVH